MDPSITQDAGSFRQNATTTTVNGTNNNLNNNLNLNHNNNNKVTAIAFTNPVYNMRPSAAHPAQQPPPLPRTTFICNGYDSFDANVRLPQANNSPNNNNSNRFVPSH